MFGGLTIISSSCKVPIVYVCQKLLKLAVSRRSYCKNKQAYLLVPRCIFVVFSWKSCVLCCSPVLLSLPTFSRCCVHWSHVCVCQYRTWGRRSSGKLASPLRESLSLFVDVVPRCFCGKLWENKIHVQANTKSVQCLCISTKHNKVRITQSQWTSRKHAYWRSLQG